MPQGCVGTVPVVATIASGIFLRLSSASTWKLDQRLTRGIYQVDQRRSHKYCQTSGSEVKCECLRAVTMRHQRRIR